MPSDNYSVILSRFTAWKDIPMWVMCMPTKKPATIHSGDYTTEPAKHYGTGAMLRWQREPQDHITTLERVISVTKMLPGYGLGPIVGRENQLAYFDFDKCLDANGDITNPKIEEFLSVVMSYTELSTSRTGLHVVVITDNPEQEYGFSPTNVNDGGKFYTNRFLKLTGEIYRDYDYTVRGISHTDYEMYKSVLGDTPVFQDTHHKPAYSSKYDSNQSWRDILASGNIIHAECRGYVGSVRKHGNINRTVTECHRILCPNYRMHSKHSNQTGKVVSGGGDVALLVKFDDGMSAVKCHHNHCNPLTHDVNLLKMLWTKIKQNRASNVDTLLKSMGVKV